jgi:hypothetical protein
VRAPRARRNIIRWVRARSSVSARGDQSVDLARRCVDARIGATARSVAGDLRPRTIGIVAYPSRSLAVVLAGLLLFFGCSSESTGTQEGTTASSGVRAEPVATCPGVPGRATASNSYRPSAPDVAADGEDVELRLVVLDGACQPMAGARVEIWHTGDSATYDDSKWRTSRLTDGSGTATYRTVYPTGEGSPHFHVRVSPPAPLTGFKEWTVAPVSETSLPQTLERALLYFHPETTPPATTPSPGSGV